MRPHLLLAAITLENFDPPWFWCGLIVASMALLVLTYHGIWRRSGRRLAWVLLALRAVGVAALLVALVKPVWKTQTQHTDKPQLAVIVDDSQSMSLPHGQGAAEDQAPRYDKARRWIDNLREEPAIEERFELRMFDVSGRPIEPAKLPDQPNAEQTDLVRALQSTTHRLRGQHAAGVVLISDGRDTTGRSDYLSMKRYPLPIYAVGFAQPRVGDDQVGDLAVVDVQAPQRVLVHNEAPVKILVRKDGGSAVEVPIRIERGGQALLSQMVALPQGATQKLVTLAYQPQEPGDFVLTVRLGAAPGERAVGNNSAMFGLKVDAEPLRVLYVEGFLRTEYTFLRDRLSNDPDVDLITFVRTASPEQASIAGVFMGDEVFSKERLERIDVVLLGDFESRMLSDSAYPALRGWVEAGGGLMVLGGYTNLGPTGLINTQLKDVLPAELDVGVGQLEEPFAFMLTDAGRRHPAMHLTGDIQRDAMMWQDLPQLRGVAAIGRAKPGATVLARHPRQAPGDGEPQEYPVLITQRFGQGHVAMLTADTTWRWSRIARLSGRPDTLYVRFWSQMIRWLARRDVKDQGPALLVSTDRRAYERGQRVVIRVIRNVASVLPQGGSAPAAPMVTVRSPDQRMMPVSVAPAGGELGQWTASFFPDRGGRFEIAAELVTQDDKGPRRVANQTTEFLVHGSKLELDDPSTKTNVLRQIAYLTGGAFAEIDDAEATRSMIELLPAEPRIRFEARTRQAWNSPLLFICFVVVITAEWIIRRRNRMV